MNSGQISTWMLDHEGGLRLSIFLSVLIIMGIAETLFPKKQRVQARGQRAMANLLLVIIDSVFVRICFPIIAVGVAAMSYTKGWGVLNVVSLPAGLKFIIALIVLDFSVYLQHIAFHKIKPLWTLHKVHHADRDIDVTTGVRFHPLEIIISMLYKIVVVLALGPSVWAVMIFEIILNASALFNHANLALPKRFDAVLRTLIVTPDMHRVHHSVIELETNRNYGFNLSIWDRLFKTYQAQPKHGHAAMKIGLSDYQTDAPTSLWWMLKVPFERSKPKG